MMKDYHPMTGNKMINKYMIVHELGRGMHGKVKLCRDTQTNELCAIKIVDKTTRRRLGRSQISSEEKIRREIAIMKKCIHPNVVRLIEVIDDPTARKIYLVLEYMEGGDVRWKDSEDRPVLQLDEARSIFRDVVLGLEYLHTQGIIHRDIKPANLLLSADGAVKISDFGVSYFSQKSRLEHDLENAPMVETGLHPKDALSRHTPPPSSSPPSSGTDRQSKSSDGSPDNRQSFHAAQQLWGDDLELAKTAGSPAFFAPELCYTNDYPSMTSSSSQTSFTLQPLPSSAVTSASLGHPSRPPITKAIDVWALGVTLYCFVYGCCPFIAETEYELFNIIPRRQLQLQESVPGRELVDKELQDLISRLLEKDMFKRITLEEVKEHPWVTKDIEDLTKWRIETNPANYQQVYVTEEEVKGAVTIMDKIKNRIRKLSISLSNMTLHRRRSKSISSTHSTHTPDSPTGDHIPINIPINIPIARSPMRAATPSSTQSRVHTSPMSMPERTPWSGSNYNGSNQSMARPLSVCSNSSSIDEADEDDERSGHSGSSAPSNTSYIGRRRLFHLAGQRVGSQNQLSSSSTDLSQGGVGTRRVYSSDQLEASSSRVAVSNGRPVLSGHSNLSKSWVFSAEDIQSGSSSLSSSISQPIMPSSTTLSEIFPTQDGGKG
ncbi:hypothetical protein CPC16_000920 [Podila verticillata]|nr:hypothetical protein BGZ59_004041 [Podila verticillata]KAF9393864.1 hypothetical protein CPC16_000920 [Podila verticillata]